MALDGFAAAGRPLRVALCSGNYNYTVDGANRTLNRLVRHLEAVEGATVRVYSPTSPTPAFRAAGELVSVPSIRIPFRSDYRFALGLPAARSREIAAFAPDVIHLSSPDLLSQGALRLARRLGVPVVASVHTLFGSYLDYYGLAWLRPPLERRLRAFYRGCDFVLAPTPALAEELEADGLEGRVRVWSRGVDRDLFDPSRRSRAWRAHHGFDDRPVVLFFGRLVKEKGLAVFADAVDRLERRGLRPQVLVVGDGPARGCFQERLPGAVFTGFLSGEAMATAVASADILLNPSATEAFGNVTLEAMASGLAPICADTPSSRTLVRDGATGLICEARDVDGFAGAVERLLAEPGLLRALGRAAREQSLDRDWGAILSGVAAVYREAIALRQAEPGGAAARRPHPRFDRLVVRPHSVQPL